MKAIRIIVVLFISVLAACNGFSDTPVSPTAIPRLSPEATKYLNDALDIMQNNSINKDKIDWPTLRAEMLNAANGAQIPADTYRIIKMALSRLNDHHSVFIDPQQASAAESGTGPTPMPPEMKLVENKFGYVAVPGYWGLNQDLMNQYGTDMQKHIAEIDQQNPCGWIVDLRGNEGGNMWPMLIGIGPILGDGKAGSWVDADGNETEWAYLNGKGMIGSEVQSEIVGEPYYLAHPDAPVAVLFGPKTVSSGEVIVISFIGRSNTRTFGSNSGGYTTANAGFPLSDEAIIFLTTAVTEDRTGKSYSNAIIPEVRTSGDNDHAGPVPDEALQWLNDQPACH